MGLLVPIAIWDFVFKEYSRALLIILGSYSSRHKIAEGKKDNKKHIYKR